MGFLQSSHPHWDHPKRRKKQHPDYRDYLDRLDGLRELYQLLKELDEIREDQRECAGDIARLLRERDLALYECHRMFQASGGATVADFHQFLPRYFQRKIKDGSVLRRGSLRLVVSR